MDGRSGAPAGFDLAVDTGAATGFEFFHFGEAGHGGVAGGGHRQGTVGGTVFHGFFGALFAQETVDEAGCEGIAAADAVKNPEVTGGGLVEFPLVPDHRRPAIHRGALHLAQGGGHGLEIG